jgi:uncharacterized membrane protein YfhO
VVLSEAPELDLPNAPVEGEVRWTERSLNRYALEVESDSDALLVLADNWYPAWKARVDGVETPVLRANHSLRAVPLQAGSHEVELFYDWGSLKGGLFTSLASVLLLVGAAGTGYLRKKGS